MDSRRDAILKLTREFAEEALISQEFVAGETPVPVSGKVLSPEDFVSLVDSSLDGWLTAGRHTKVFERQLADFVGARSALFVNSGNLVTKF
jgi:CDP-6-deoxy-D-xylo-4-hexulose-3-dehydrase